MLNVMVFVEKKLVQPGSQSVKMVRPEPTKSISAAAFRRPLNFAVMLLLIPAATISVSGQSADTAKPVLENERVAVWDMVLTPGTPSPMSHHATDFVVVFIQDAKIRTTDDKGKATVATHHAGDAVFGEKGTADSKEVLSGAPVHLMVVSLKDYSGAPVTNPSKYPEAFPREGSTKLLENNRVAVWHYTWALNKVVPEHFHSRDMVVVYQHDGVIMSIPEQGPSVPADDKAGTAAFIKAGRLHSEELVKGEETATLVELK